MWSRTKQIFQKRPLLMNMMSFGTMYVSAEVAQQCILMQLNPEKKHIDWNLVKNYAIIGWGGIGPALFYWYRVLDRLLPGATRAMVVKKVLTDQLCSSPACIAMFFAGMGVLEGKEDVFAELKAKFWSTYKMSCCFWLPAQAINFALLPPYTRVAFVGVASFIWVNVLCLVKRQEISETKIDNPEVLEKAAKD
ncbi:mpv17-like protein isoform X2 [Argiope bruennichi]|uniref:Mpv17-like protein like n=1 Tax=Argiope bruennichi TaxID=94029 RepID=A0A8T0F6V8_ARGBR|nr:mpv17-like protein isoform X2 [Argiope bruennichi]KAF8786924.1 Mpv17-like protein like [Argiope bruennichi]